MDKPILAGLTVFVVIIASGFFVYAVSSLQIVNGPTSHTTLTFTTSGTSTVTLQTQATLELYSTTTTVGTTTITVTNSTTIWTTTYCTTGPFPAC